MFSNSWVGADGIFGGIWSREPKSLRPRMKRTKLLAHRYHRYSLYSSFNVIIKSRATPVAEIWLKCRLKGINTSCNYNLFSVETKKSPIISTMWPLDSHKREWASTNNHLSTISPVYFLVKTPLMVKSHHIFWNVACSSLFCGRLQVPGAESLNHRFSAPPLQRVQSFHAPAGLW